jgi:hypothetical protein
MSAAQVIMRHGLVARTSTGSVGKDMFAVMIPCGLDVAGENAWILTLAASACRPHANVAGDSQKGVYSAMDDPVFLVTAG